MILQYLVLELLLHKNLISLLHNQRAACLIGVPVAAVQKTTVRTFTVNGEEENEECLIRRAPA
jgi:hypothetical protein